MSLDAMQDRAPTSLAQDLVRRHTRQIFHRKTDYHRVLQQAYAISFRPGDRTASFHGKLLRPLGTSVLVAVSYEDPDEKGRKRMPLRGYRTELELDGTASYGCHAEADFHYDGAWRTFKGARGKRLDPFFNPSLMELLLNMDRACERWFQLDLPFVPHLPRIMLGFAPSQPPEFEDSPALRRFAAKRIGVRVEHLGANGDLLLDRLLREVWEQHLVPAGSGHNNTGLLLADAELCTQVRASLRVFEDFSTLVGTNTWNPARVVEPLRAANPAPSVLTEFNIDVTQDFNQSIPAEVVDAMVVAMRQRVGSVAIEFSDEELLDGLTAFDQPLTAWTAALPQLRGKLTPAIEEATTDEDLLRAARNIEGPLFSSGLCRVQVLRRRAMGKPWDLFFTPDDLGRRMSMDLATKESIGHTEATPPVDDNAPTAQLVESDQATLA